MNQLIVLDKQWDPSTGWAVNLSDGTWRWWFDGSEPELHTYVRTAVESKNTVRPLDDTFEQLAAAEGKCHGTSQEKKTEEP